MRLSLFCFPSGCSLGLSPIRIFFFFGGQTRCRVRLAARLRECPFSPGTDRPLGNERVGQTLCGVEWGKLYGYILSSNCLIDC